MKPPGNLHCNPLNPRAVAINYRGSREVSMAVNRIALCAGFGVLLAAGFFVADMGAQPGTLRQIVPGVWFREGDIKELGHCNNIIIEMKDYLIVVDANFPSGAKLAMADAKRVSQKPVKYVFDTHHH